MPPQAITIHGHAIVSADGMIAAADGSMPPALRRESDWQLFQQALDAAGLVVLGRIGHQRHPNPGRRRLVLTSAVARLAADPEDALATLWNPAGCSLERAIEELGARTGTIAVTGGTRVFDHFAPHYTAFSLSEVHDAVLPGGTRCFSTGHPRCVLAQNGLVPMAVTELDTALTLTAWRRPGSA